jgi:hypothetical protein
MDEVKISTEIKEENESYIKKITELENEVKSARTDEKVQGNKMKLIILENENNKNKL